MVYGNARSAFWGVSQSEGRATIWLRPSRLHETVVLRALGWLRDAGLEEPTARTFAGSAYAPLTDELRNALIALFQMRWPRVVAELTPEDWSEYQRLCLPESPDFILTHPDYYAFFTYSMFCGKVTVQ